MNSDSLISVLPGDETTYHKLLVLNNVVHDLGMKERRNLFRLMREEGMLLNQNQNDTASTFDEDEAIHMFFTGYGMTVGEFSTLHLLNGKETATLNPNQPHRILSSITTTSQSQNI